MGVSWTWEGSVAVVKWDDGENRINLESLAALNSTLDVIEAVSGPLAVVLTGEGKFFSNGLDLARFGTEPGEFGETLRALHRTIGRLVIFPAYTVAAINGHAFAAGALVSCALDYRVMREDRGYWCMNEAEIGLALDETLAAILFNRLAKATAVNAILTAKRYTGPDALAAGIVEAVANEDGVLPRAIQVATAMADTDRHILGVHKRLVHGELAALLGAPGS